MATQKKKKVIVWAKEFEKVLGPFQKKTDKLFADFDKEVAKKPMTTSERNELWRKKYQARFDALDKAEDAAYTRLWNKYHDKSTYKPKACYIIK